MSEILKNQILQKNRRSIANSFKSNNDDSTNQKMLMNSCLFYYHPYFYNLSLNSRREELQQYSGRNDDMDNENDNNEQSNIDNQMQTSSKIKNAFNTLKQKKQKNESPLIEFKSAYFSKVGQLVKNYPKFNHITYLSLQNCCLCSIPKQILSLPKDLISLDLSNNFITKIPLNISWKKLKKLNLAGNWLHEWPPIFEHEKFDSLEYLNLGCNQIEKISPNQTPFHNLKTLILSDNWLNTFPLWIKDCPELRILSISQNSFISQFDLSCLCSMTNLKFLDLSSIKVNKVPLKMQDSLLVFIVSKSLIDSIPIGNFQLVC